MDHFYENLKTKPINYTFNFIDTYGSSTGKIVFKFLRKVWYRGECIENGNKIVTLNGVSSCGSSHKQVIENEFWQKLEEDINFWSRITLDRVVYHFSNPESSLVINGKFYTYDPSNPIITDGYDYLGFAGHNFVILKDNKYIQTNNLWAQGDVPEEFRNICQDNASFVKSRIP